MRNSKTVSYNHLTHTPLGVTQFPKVPVGTAGKRCWGLDQVGLGGRSGCGEWVDGEINGWIEVLGRLRKRDMGARELQRNINSASFMNPILMTPTHFSPTS